MKGFIPSMALTVVMFCLWATVAGAAENRNNGINEQVSGLQEKMMNDKEIMGLILALQNDPDMQELLKDPSVLNAVSDGDINTLTGNPRFMRLLENARVKEIQRRLEP